MSRPRLESNFLAQDYANIRNDKRLQKSLDSQEEILFSDEVTKTNHQQRRQQRVFLLTSEALYNYKRNHYQKPQRRVPLENIEAIMVSVESTVDLVLRLKDLDNMKLEMPRRNMFVKLIQGAIRSKTGREVERLDVSMGILDSAWRDDAMTSQKVKKTQEMLSSHFSSMHLDEIQEDGGPGDEEEETTEETRSTTPSPSRFGIIRKSLAMTTSPVSLITSGTTSLKKKDLSATEKAKKEARAKRALPVPPKRKSTINNIIRRVSAQQLTIKYFPRCPPCRVPIGVVQPIWSLMERALEPLLDDIKPAAGLVRCADILLKLVGEHGPKSAEDAMKSVAALCFDKDAARALLQSLSDNVPVLGGSALIDSLDALQRCEDPVVRSWAIKSMWKILPMCMSENAMPTTSTKWMTALQGPVAGEGEGMLNLGEAWFLRTYFRGVIKIGVHEKEPLRRIAKRKGSFSILGGGFRNSTAFPGGLSPMGVQQAFAQVLLQNMFDVQRRAAYAIAAQNKNAALKEQQQQELQNQEESAGGGTGGSGGNGGAGSKTLNGLRTAATGSMTSFGGEHLGGYDDDAIMSGVVESDCNTVLELLLNSLTRPHDPDRKIEVTGKRICNTMLLPTLMGMLVLVDEDSVRQSVLKDVSLLLLRSETNLKAVLDIPDWQLLFIPLLQTVPKDEKLRTAEQRILHKYVLNLLTMIHTYCFKEPNCRGGPLNSMLGSTFKGLAVFGDWTPDTIGVARWVLFGLVTQLSLTARHWWHDGDAPEWNAFAALVRTIENFVFFLPDSTSSTTSTGAGAASTSKVSSSIAPAPSGNGKKKISDVNDLSVMPTAKDVAERALKRSGTGQTKGSMGSMSEDESDSDEEEGGGKDQVRDLSGKRRKRKFSITPVYELKGFEPVVRPVGPSDALRITYEFDWISGRVADSSDDSSAPSGLNNIADRTRSTRVGRDALSSSSASGVFHSTSGVLQSAASGVFSLSSSQAQIVQERKVGMHLHETKGTSNDIKLVEMVVELLKRMGITGNAPEDQRRGELLKTAGKKERGLLKTASEWCKAFMTIRELLVDLDLAVETGNQDALSNTMQRIATFIESRHTVTKAATAKLAAAQTKAVATKLEASVLKQRQLAKQKLEQHASAQPVKVEAAITIAVASTPNDLAAAKANSAAQRALARSQGGRHATPTRSSSVVSRTRFYSSLTADDDRHSEAPPPLPPMPSLNEEYLLSPQAIRRPSKLHNRKMSVLKAIPAERDQATAFTTATSGMDEFEYDLDEEGPPCDECGAPVSDEFDAVHQFDFTFHSDCFVCDECQLPLLKSENPDENNLFYKDSELKKFCGAECRMAHLEKGGNKICPGCMCFFAKGDQAINACGRMWHLLHLRCQDCRTPLGMAGKEYFPVEIEQGEVWPYCSGCHSKRFRTCAKCIQPIETKDDAVDALGRVYHREHFNCFRCGDQFKGKEFYVDGHGDTARALCEKCWNDSNSPRIVCDACGDVLGDTDDAVELGGKIYHASKRKTCFKCSVCTKPLHEGQVFESADHSAPMCDECFYKSKGFKCGACDKVITGEVLHAEHKTWHPQCFTCQDCDGVPLSGRYLMVETDVNKGVKRPRPMCEAHWTAKNAVMCAHCQLAVTKDVLALSETEKYHPSCLVCAHCTQPLATKQGAHQLHRGPDNKWYCAKHADGVCAYEDCELPCWADGKVFKVAGQYFCKPHAAKVSQAFLSEPCAACESPIREGEGLQALNRWYHIPQVSRCFLCFVCHEPFYDAEDFVTMPGTQDAVHRECKPL